MGKDHSNLLGAKVMTMSDMSGACLDLCGTQSQHAASTPLTVEDVGFTPPQGGHLEESALLERCIGTAAEGVKSQRILEVISAGEDGVFIQYEYEQEDGARHRVTEFIAVRDGRLLETQIAFGGLL